MCDFLQKTSAFVQSSQASPTMETWLRSQLNRLGMTRLSSEWVTCGLKKSSFKRHHLGGPNYLMMAILLDEY